MTLVKILVIALALCAGWIVRLVLDRIEMSDTNGRSLRVSGAEFVVVAILMTTVFTPAVSALGVKLSKDQILRYTEFVNGVETVANDDVTTCRAGHAGSSSMSGQSNCDWTYVSGWYSYTDTCYRTKSVHHTDTKGKSYTTTETESYRCTKTASIHTPYATREHRYSIDSSVGFMELPAFKFKRVYLDAQPVAYSKRAIPQDIPRGAPSDWQEAYERLQSGDPRAVTALHDYDNYILAAKDPVLVSYSNKIPQYKQAGLLPDHTADMLKDPIKGPSSSQADKLSFVGVRVADQARWQKSLMRYNSACGLSKLQCDMHVILVDSARVPVNESVPYTGAVKAYFQSEHFGKRAIAKNAVILVLGISNDTSIVWAEAATGMPHGNESMIEHIRQYVPGTLLSPEALFGSPKSVISGGKATITHQEPLGVAEDIMFNRVPFKRARMTCNDGTCVGYKDLISKIEPTLWQKFTIVLVAELIAALLWFWVSYTTVIDDLWDPIRSRYARARTTTYEPPTRSHYGRNHEDA